MKVLSIDLGATTGRLMVVTYLERKVSYEEIFRFENVIEKRIDNSLYWDMDMLVQNVIHGINLSFAKHPDIASIGVDSWGIDYIYVDAKGEKIDNPHCYRDKRTINSSQRVLNIINFKNIYDITGIQFLNINSLYQLYDDVINHYEMVSNASKLMMVSDYIPYILTGRITSEITNLSTMSILDVRTLEVSKPLVDALWIKDTLFPKRVYPKELIGYLKHNILNIKRNIPVYAVCSHDTSSAVLATPLNEKSVFISSGTWSLVGVELDQFRNDQISLENNFTNELGYQNHFNYLKNVMGMFIISELRKDFKKMGEKVDFVTIDKLIKETPDIEKYIDVDDPTFSTPGNMFRKIQNYLRNTGQSYPTFHGQYYKLIYQSMACKYRETIGKIKRVYPDIEDIIIIGGGNQADILNQYTANVTGIRVSQGFAEAAIVGNGLVQLMALNEIKDLNEAREIASNSLTNQKKYLPEDKELWDKKYEKYLSVTRFNQGDKRDEIQFCRTANN